VPAPVLAKAWRGGSRQASLSRLLAMCDVEPMSEEQARRVGVLAGQAAHDDIVDVTVVEGAIRRGDAVVTSNEEHIGRIAAGARARLRIEAI
jgi:predicted nucleic acid-binding protein